MKTIANGFVFVKFDLCLLILDVYSFSERVSDSVCFGTLVQLVLALIARSLTKLAFEVHWTSNLSEFPLRVAFVRALTEYEIIGISGSFKA